MRCNVTLKEVIQLSSVPKFDVQILDDLQKISTISKHRNSSLAYEMNNLVETLLVDI